MMMGEMRVDVGKFILEKLHEFLLLLGSCWSFLVETPEKLIQHVGKFLLEILHEFVHLFENFWSFLVETPEKLIQHVGKFLLEKFHEFLLLLGSCWSFLVEKFDEVISPEKIKHVGKFLLEKLHEFVHLSENFWSFLVKKLDEVFPPETRAEKIKHWLEIGLPVALPAALLLLCIWYCGASWLRFCCSRCGSCLKSCYRCLCRCGRRSIKMMRAPGRGYMMPRHVFESNPRGYFINLRSTK